MPAPPRREPDKLVANFKHLTINGCALHLALFPPGDMTGIRYPDMLIVFNADPEAYRRSNGYIVSEQGKPPDFVLESGSPSTGHVDTGAKRDDYAALGIPEYWRFDETGRSHGARLAGDRLVDGVYRPVAIEELEEDVLQGRSVVLHLDLRREHGQLKWHDPETGRHFATCDDQVARAKRAAAEAELRAERKARAVLEAQVRELEAQLRRLNA